MPGLCLVLKQGRRQSPHPGLGCRCPFLMPAETADSELQGWGPGQVGGGGGVTKTEGSGVTWSLGFREPKVRPGEPATSQEGLGALCSPGLQKEGSSLQRPRPTWEARGWCEMGREWGDGDGLFCFSSRLEAEPRGRRRLWA